MRTWHLRSLPVEPHHPEILSSLSPDGRAILIALPAGERMQEHEVHERAWLVLVDGELEVTTPDGAREAGGTGLLFEFEPGERHEVRATTDARLLLLLTPWPGEGHPGALSDDQRHNARERAREAAEG